LFLSALNTATIVLWFFRTNLETFYLELTRCDRHIIPRGKSLFSVDFAR
jgi:hypothetical protein